jgi:oligopeptide transport system permease protein
MSDPTEAVVATQPHEPRAVVGGTAGIDAGLAAPDRRDKPRGLIGDAWFDLRHKPLFWISTSLIVLFLVMAAVPSLFTSTSPTDGELSRSLVGPSSEAWFGYDIQGRDVYARAIYGAKASIMVAVLATIGTILIGAAVGIMSGYLGGWMDGLLSRVADIFFGIPFVLGAIVILTTFNTPGSDRGQYEIMAIVIASLVVLTWPVSMRIMRSSVLSTRNADYIIAARALGAGPDRIILKHLLPNCLAPVLVYGTILIGAFIGAEATLSYLGIGLQTPVVSWGIMIAEAQHYLRVAAYLLLFPAAFLVTAVLSFVMLGEAVREALDPKMR